jgi:glycine cleavage system H lipoate-binding protein
MFAEKTCDGRRAEFHTLEIHEMSGRMETIVSVGITDFAQEELAMSSRGAQVGTSQPRTFGIVESVKTPILCASGGTIVDVNKILKIAQSRQPIAVWKGG